MIKRMRCCIPLLIARNLSLSYLEIFFDHPTSPPEVLSKVAISAFVLLVTFWQDTRCVLTHDKMCPFVKLEAGYVDLGSSKRETSPHAEISNSSRLIGSYQNSRDIFQRCRNCCWYCSSAEEKFGATCQFEETPSPQRASIGVTLRTCTEVLGVASSAILPHMLDRLGLSIAIEFSRFFNMIDLSLQYTFRLCSYRNVWCRAAWGSALWSLTYKLCQLVSVSHIRVTFPKRVSLLSISKWPSIEIPTAV